MKLAIATTAFVASTIVAGVAAFADPGNSQGQGNNDAAQNMAGDLQGNRGSASIASAVSGAAKGAARGDSGWGNIGSRALSGDQVSDYGNKP